MPDSADFGRLIVRFDADLTRLEDKMNRAVRVTQRTARDMERSVNGVNLQRGLGNIISSGQTRVMQEATARMGLMGGALEAIGPAGMAAAAAIAAFAGATTLALNTARWAEALGDTANQLALTTTQVQELQFAATAAGIPVDQMTTSLVGLNEALGSAQGHDRMSARYQRIFSELGIDSATLANVRDVTQLMPMLADGFQRLFAESPARAAALGERLKIDPEVLHELEQGRNHWNALTEALQRYGGVVSEEGVQRSAELADQMRILHGVADTLSHRLGAALAPAFVSIANSALMAVDAVTDLIEWLGRLDARSVQATNAFNQAVAARARVAAFESGTYAQAVAAGMPGIGGARVRASAAAAANEDARNALIRGINIQIQGITAAGNLSQPTTTTRQRLNDTNDTTGGASRARGAGGSAGGSRSVHLSDGPAAATALDGLTGHFDSEAAALDFIWGRDAFQRSGGARTIDQNVDLITPETYLAPLVEAEDQMRETYRNVIQGGLEAAIHGGWPGLAKYMAEQLQQHLVQRLADTLTNLFVNAMQSANGQISLSGGGGGGGWLNTLFQVGAAIVGGGHAGASTGAPVHAHGLGTDFAPGGLTKVGEYGMEYVNLPRGAQVFSASASRALSRMGASVAGPGGAVLHQIIHLHAEGAVLGNELMATLDSRAVQYAAAAFNGARAIVPSDLGRRALRKLS